MQTLRSEIRHIQAIADKAMSKDFTNSLIKEAGKNRLATPESRWFGLGGVIMDRLIDEVFTPTIHGTDNARFRYSLKTILYSAWVSSIIFKETGKETIVHYSRNKNDYKSSFSPYAQRLSYTRHLRAIETLWDKGLLNGWVAPPHPNGNWQSWYAPTKTLTGLFEYYEAVEDGMVLEDFRKDVVLVRTEDDGIDINPKSLPIYKDFASAREKVIAINSVNADHTVSLGGDVVETRLHRVFNSPTMKRGGRFWGRYQFYSEEMRKRLLIDGEEVVEIDFSAMQPSLLYSRESLPVPDEPYDIGLRLFPVEMNKDIPKMGLLFILNCDARGEAKKALNYWMVQEYGYVPVSADWVIQKLMEKHSDMSCFFECGEGMKLQLLESEIAESVMLGFAEAGECCLCVHDSFIVRKTLQTLLMEKMKSAFSKVMGQEPKLKVK